MPAARQAVRHAFAKLLSGFPCRWKSHGMIPGPSLEHVGLGALSLQSCPQLRRHHEHPAVVVLRGAGLQPDGARLEVDLSPLERQHLAPDPPARDIGECHDRPCVLGQVPSHGLVLIALEEALADVVLLELLDPRRVAVLAPVPLGSGNIVVHDADEP